MTQQLGPVDLGPEQRGPEQRGPEHLGSVHDIPLGEGRAYAVDGTAIAVFRLRDGSVRALPAVCPHRGGPLADGQIDLKQVVCPLHLYAWDLATGCSLSGQSDLISYPVRLDGDQIILGD